MIEIKESDLKEFTLNLLRDLFPICRSITGDGVRKTLKILKKYCPELKIIEYESGKKVYDWIIPREWNIKDAYIKDLSGNKIIDFNESNLHVVSYSVPIKKIMSFNELKDHLYTLPSLPDAIPYRTSYYKENWGFCLSQNQFDLLDTNCDYEVSINSELKHGSMTLGEIILPGKKKEEILISTYCCHPSLANDNLSGLILTLLLILQLKSMDLVYTYRILIVPETIGAIAYLFHNEEAMKNIFGGFVLTTVGGPGKFGYKNTFLGNHEIDELVKLTFKEYGLEFVEYPFVPDGSDERQYSSPGFRIAMGTICKDKYYEYDYYHTSLDNLDFVKPDYILETLFIYRSVLKKLENNNKYISLNPNCEVHLGKRNLYPELGGAINQGNIKSEKNQKDDSVIEDSNFLDAILWIMFLSDGCNSILDIANRTKIPFFHIKELCNMLEKENLLKKID